MITVILYKPSGNQYPPVQFNSENEVVDYLSDKIVLELGCRIFDKNGEEIE